LCRIQLAGNCTEEALQGTTNLLALAAGSGERGLQAESAAFRAGILEQLNRLPEAMATYELNLGADVPAEQRSFALLKTVELAIEENKPDEAARRIERFLSEFPTEASADAILIALGELHLKEYLASEETNRSGDSATAVAPATNHVQLALAQFDAVITNAPASPLLGKALLDRGWCLWLDGRMAESRSAFEAAARAQPFSEDAAVARFKWADAQYLQKDFTGALTNYEAVVDGFSSLPAVRERLLEPALYQVVRTALAANDMAAATNAIARILVEYPAGFFCQSALLLVGQGVDRRGQPDDARRIFAEFEKRFPDSPLLPEVRLAIARTYEQQKNWAAAIGVYDGWVTNFAGHGALPLVLFQRAWANYQAGFQTNAIALFSSLMAEFPTNQAAALALNWVADYYFQSGDFAKAEENYQLLFQRWPASDLTYQARMMAGRSAAARLGFAEAVGYFTALINDVKCPPSLVAQALFAYGDATMQLESSGTNRPFANVEEAVRAFGKLQQLYPTNELAVLAWGRIGDCYLQLAAQDPKYYDSSAQAYQKVIDNARADCSARSQAEVGLALVLDKQARRKPEAELIEARKLALEHYLNVVYGKNLREGERVDPFWVKKAGLEATKLAEELQMWEQAVKLYEHLRQLLPSLTPMWDDKILKAKAHLPPA
jgi:tetratricopeptide (TPR) repeat protein